MEVRRDVLAKKYAIAFCNIYGILSFDEEEKIRQLEQFFRFHKKWYVVLNLPVISRDLKKKAFRNIIHAYALPILCEKLIFLLLEHGRIRLMDKVLKNIRLWNKQQRNEEEFVVSSSHALCDDKQNMVINFIQLQVSTKVLATFVLDHSLMSGLRIQSKDHLWEQSIAKQLRMIKYAMQQGMLC